MVSRARAAGVGPDTLAACLNKGELAQRVRWDMELAGSLGISSTPTFLVGLKLNGQLRVLKVLVGARSAAELGQAVEAALDASTK